MEKSLDRETKIEKTNSGIIILLFNGLLILCCFLIVEFQKIVKDTSVYFLILIAGEIIFLLVTNAIISLVKFRYSRYSDWKKWRIMSILYLIALIVFVGGLYLFIMSFNHF